MQHMAASVFSKSLEFLKGVGPKKYALLEKELGLKTYGDLIQYYPFRHEDRSQYLQIGQITAQHSFVQLRGKVQKVEKVGPPKKQRLVAHFADDTGTVELVWFKGLAYAMGKLRLGVTYVVFGRPNVYGHRVNIAHPEIEPLSAAHDKPLFMQPVYSVTDALRRGYLDTKALAKIQQTLLKQVHQQIPETLSQALMQAHQLIDKKKAIVNIHFPRTPAHLNAARQRLKFEELFFTQLRLLRIKQERTDKYKSIALADTSLLTTFYQQHLPFELTGAQKRVIKEIHRDMRSGLQMNRLLQGDVGSGKTIVAFICMLQAVGSQAQAALMAPTEILAEQHFRGLLPFATAMGLQIVLLTGSTKTKQRRFILEGLAAGQIHIIVGTHALLEDRVQFNRLGLAVVDEQHRFGVAQRARLWQKNTDFYPHVLVMTATPIPRTLAMSLYGDLDLSVIDELPAGRKPIQTSHATDAQRLKVFEFMRQQIEQGRQIYIVYPLIEESEKLALKDLMDGYESVSRAFKGVPISIVHGRMKAEDKDFEMQRFIKAETKIMVATTVIEVGVNVPNASVMIIENAERFGLAQLHQLRGRVGRGAAQSYCILVSSNKPSQESRTRIETMVRTNNGFEIADVDLKLRGPGDLSGTQQSGVAELLVADLAKDAALLETARQAAKDLMQEDPRLEMEKNRNIAQHVASLSSTVVNWARIS